MHFICDSIGDCIGWESGESAKQLFDWQFGNRGGAICLVDDAIRTWSQPLLQVDSAVEHVCVVASTCWAVTPATTEQPLNSEQSFGADICPFGAVRCTEKTKNMQVHINVSKYICVYVVV